MFPEEIIDIDKTKYISSIGLMKACDDNQVINYIDPWKLTIDWEKLINANKPNCIICVKMENFDGFVKIFNKIPYKFTLVTCDSDYTFPFGVPNRLMNKNIYENIINSDKIIKWYSVNCYDNIHTKLHSIPIGLNYHCESFWGNPKKSPIEQDNILQGLNSKSEPFNKRIPLCYSNFHFTLHNTFENDRQKAINGIPSSLVFYEPTKISKEKTWENQTKYAFVISPHGNGMDSHRTWEALILGCIVIVKTSPIDSLYKDLPVLIVENWNDITEKLLKDTIIDFSNKAFLYEKLTLKYWINNIRF